MVINPLWISATVGALMLCVAATTATIAIRTFKRQKTVGDVQLALDIFKEINRYWDKATADPSNHSYYIGQILAQFEVAAALFNRGILSADAETILKDHIVEVFSVLEATDYGKVLISQCQSSTTTFEQLRKFAKKWFPQGLLTQSFSEHNDGI